MTGAVLDRPGSRSGEDRRTALDLGPLGDGKLTLEERLNGTLHAARQNGSTECPVCDGAMTHEAGVAGEGARALARCDTCGTTLS